MFLTLMYITNNPRIALIAEKNGVERIWIDLETLGKEERQKGMNTVKSKHTIKDIRKIRPLLSRAELLVRINPWNDRSEEEIENVISAGADLIMLPMWKSCLEVEQFVKAVDGRCKTVLLLETRQAVECIDEVLDKCRFDEIHVGLNDLHISYKLSFMFELLTNGIVEELCKKISERRIPYGFGGIAKVGEGELPAEKIMMEHYRLGSTRAILSRSFCNVETIENIGVFEEIFEKNIKELREYENKITRMSLNDLLVNKREVKECVQEIVAKKEACNVRN